MTRLLFFFFSTNPKNNGTLYLIIAFFLILLFVIIGLIEELTFTTLLSQTNEISLLTCEPVMIYHNVDLDKLQILKDNKG